MYPQDARPHIRGMSNSPRRVRTPSQWIPPLRNAPRPTTIAAVAAAPLIEEIVSVESKQDELVLCEFDDSLAAARAAIA